MRRRSTAVSALLFVLMATAASAPGRADAQSAEDKTAADALFEEGKKLLGEKKFAEACSRFERSQRLDPGVGTLLFLADCYDTIGRTASAWSTFREAASAAKTAGQADRERTARERAAKLENTLFLLTISVPSAPPGLTITRNDVPVKAEVWSSAVPVDPGTYTLSATAPGKKPWTAIVEVPKGSGARTIEVPSLEDAPAEKAAEAATSAPSVTATLAPTAPPPRPRTPPVQSLGYVLGSTGIAAVLGGLVVGGMAMAQNNDVKKSCPDVKCGDPLVVDQSKAVGALADVSTTMLVAGGVLAAGGLVMVLVAPTPRAASAGSKAPVRTTAWLSPMAGNGVAGVRAGGEW
ncbi:MAG: hypothetical protein U0441_25990 [Polyangiaceae bacterium]